MKSQGFPLRTRTARQDSSGPHALRYMMHTLLPWQARAAGETWRVAPWKRSIHSKIREEQSCSDSAACVLESAHSSSAAVNPLAMSRQQQATLALDISMPMTRAAALVWRASVALGPALSRCERARGTAAWKESCVRVDHAQTIEENSSGGRKNGRLGKP